MKDVWLWALGRIDVPWDQLAYLHGSKSDLAEAYVIGDIPYAVIIDKNGIMVEMLRFPEKTLPDAMERLFEKNK